MDKYPSNQVFKEITEKEFRAFSRAVKSCSYEQTVEMAKLRHKRGYEVSYLALFVDDRITVAALAYSQSILGGKTMGIYYGPIYNEQGYLISFLKDLKKYAKRQKILRVTIYPYEDYQVYDNSGTPLGKENQPLLALYQSLNFRYQGQETGFTNEQIFWHYVKDLSALSEETLLSSFSKKGRSMLKKAKTFGIQIRSLEKKDLAIFEKVVTATAKRRGYSSREVDYYIDLFEAFKDKAEFLVATLKVHDYLDNILAGKANIEQQLKALEEDVLHSPSAKKKNRLRDLEGQLESFLVREAEARQLLDIYDNEEVVLAGGLFIYTPQELVYLYSGSYTEFNKFYAPALLQEYAMQKAIRQGIPFYNMLGVTGKFDGSDGVLGFKQNFNGYVIQKFSSFTYYPQPLKSRILKGLKSLFRRN